MSVAIDRTLAGAALALVVIAGWAWSRPLPHVADPNSAVATLAAIPPDSDADALEQAAQAVIDANPFRLSHAPADVPYVRPTATQAPIVTSAPRIRPTFVVKGIVGGPPFQAVMDGIPGAPAGSVVRAGNTFDLLVIRAVTRDSVIIQGPDTTWRLTLKRAP